MPKSFTISPVHGVSVTNARPGENATILTSGFVPCFEGEAFFRILEGIASSFSGQLSQPLGGIDHFLLLIRAEWAASLYVNELPMNAICQILRSVEAGEEIYTGDIGDVISVDLGIDIPDDAAVVWYFSSDWRRGLFFDFGPVQPEPVLRSFDLKARFASCLCALQFGSIFSLSDADWQKLIHEGWFPFVGLHPKNIEEMLVYLKAGWPISELLPKFGADIQRVAATIPEMLARSRAYSKHEKLVSLAIEHFSKGDFISAAFILYPQIEGVLRAAYIENGEKIQPTHRRLVEVGTVVGMGGRHEFSLLLPTRFEAYLKENFFGRFEWQNPTGVSRHTIGHGVVRAEEVTLESVSIAILTLHHLLIAFRT